MTRTNEDLSRLAALAQAVRSQPKDTKAWIQMSLNPHPLVPKGSADFEASCECYSSIGEKTTLEEMTDLALALYDSYKQHERDAGHALRWAICQSLMEKQRNGTLDQTERELLIKVSV